MSRWVGRLSVVVVAAIGVDVGVGARLTVVVTVALVMSVLRSNSVPEMEVVLVIGPAVTGR